MMPKATTPRGSDRSRRVPEGGWRRGAALGVLLGSMAGGAQDFAVEGFIVGGGGGVSTGDAFGVAGVLGESFQGRLTGGGFATESEVTWDAPELTWLRPAIATKRVGQALEVVWSSRNGVFGVQEASNLDGAPSADSVGTPDRVGGRCVLTLPVGADTRFFRLISASPFLSVTRSGANLEISWTSTAAGFVLQETTALRGAPWTDVSSSASVVGDRWVVVLPAPSDTRFLRLRGP